MRNPLNKRFIREFKHNSGRYIAISLILIVTIAFISGYFIVADGIATGLKENRMACKVEDGLFSSYYPLSKTAITEAEKLGLSVCENYYIDADVLKNTTLRVFKDREKINLATALEGRLPSSKNEIAIERLFAKTNKIKVGTYIELNNTKMKITGLISLPDYSSLFKKNSDMVMDSFHFGVAVVTEETFNTLPENGLTYNYAYYFDKRDLTNKEKNDLAEDITKTLVLNGTSLTNFCTAQNNQSISFVDDDMGGDEPMMKAFLFIVLCIMAFVFTVVINSTIEEEASIIGTLLASGYKKRELILHYLSITFWVTLISGVVGNVSGYTFMPLVFKNMYYSTFGLPALEIRFNIEALLLTTVVPIVMMLVINFISLNSKLSISPLRFLRHDLKKQKGKKARKLPDISFINRFRLRVILQNKGSYITLFFGILFAGFILMFGLCLTPMINHYIDEINESVVSEYQYILKAPVELANKEDSEEFTIYSLETYLKLAQKNIEVSFYGVNDESKYFKDLTFAEKEEGACFSDSLAKKLGLEVGDIVTFTDPYSEEKYELEVTGTYDYDAGLTVFMKKSQLNKMLGYKENYFNGYLSNKALEIDEKYLATKITANDMVKVGKQMLVSFGQMVPLFIIAAILIYMALMYILTKLVIDKNAVNISFMKVFGYEDDEIHKLYLNATTITIMASLILTLPLVYIGIKECFKIMLIKIGGYLETYIPFYLYVCIVLIGLVSYFIINFFHIRRVNKIEMTIALKNRE